MEMAWNVGDNILGGKNGPTSVFLAGNSQMFIAVLAVTIAVGVIICFFWIEISKNLVGVYRFVCRCLYWNSSDVHIWTRRYAGCCCMPGVRGDIGGFMCGDA